jgi:hypothetical protein
MSHPLRRPFSKPSIPDHEECDEERVAEVMRKIAYVAACIDLYRWRNVIDQVLREIDAERRASEGAAFAAAEDRADDRRAYGKRFSAYAGPRRLNPQAA